MLKRDHWGSKYFTKALKCLLGLTTYQGLLKIIEANWGLPGLKMAHPVSLKIVRTHFGLTRAFFFCAKMSPEILLGLTCFFELSLCHTFIIVTLVHIRRLIFALKLDIFKRILILIASFNLQRILIILINQ